MTKFGYHVNFASLEQHLKDGFKAFQMFPGHDTFKIIKKWPDEDKVFIRSLISEYDASAFFHSAYGATLTVGPDQIQKTHDYLQKLLDLAADLNFEGVVLHAGSETVREGARQLAEDMVASLQIPDKTFLMLESMASKKCLLHGLNSLLTDNPRIKYVIDTEHVYAYGVDLMDDTVSSSYAESLKGKVGLIHLNNIQAGFGLGCAKDRHDYCHLGTMDGEKLVRFALRLDVPMVCERSIAVGRFDEVQNEVNLIKRMIDEKGQV